MPPSRPEPRPDNARTASQRLEKTIELLDQRYGPATIQSARDLPLTVVPPHIASGFQALDALTGCNGIPVGHVTLLSGRTTSGKLTLAYNILAHAQHGGRAPRGKSALTPDSVGIFDLTRSSDPDYIARCGLDLQHTLFVRPPDPEQAMPLLFDLLQGYGFKALLVDGLGDLLKTRRIARGFDAALPQLARTLRQARCALICLDEPAPPWLSWLKLGSGAIAHCASLHVDIKREAWTSDSNGQISGYTAHAQLIKSRWNMLGRAGGDDACTLSVEVAP